MGTNIGTLDLLLRAKTAAFGRGIRSAKRVATSLASHLTSVAKRITKFGAVAAGAGIAVGVFLVKQEMKAMDATTKLANRIGLSTEALTGLQHAAEISGVSADKFSLSLERFTRRLGEAAGGTGEAADALETLGLSAKAMIKLDADENFKLVAERLAKLSTAAEKADVAYGLFGRAGTEMLNMLALNRKGIEELQRDAEKLGFTFTELAGKRVEAANDALNRAWKTIRGVARAIAVHLSPMIKAAADGFVNWATAGDGMRANIVNALKWITRGFAKILSVIDLAIASFEKFRIAGLKAKQVSLIILSATPGGGTEMFDRISKAIVQVGNDISTAEKAVKDAMQAFKKETRGKGIIDFFDKLQKKADAAATTAVNAMQKMRGAFSGGGVGGAGSGGATSRTQARVLNPALTFVPAMRSLESIIKKNPQIETTNQRLLDIKNAIVRREAAGIF